MRNFQITKRSAYYAKPKQQSKQEPKQEPRQSKQKPKQSRKAKQQSVRAKKERALSASPIGGYIFFFACFDFAEKGGATCLP